VRGQAVKTMANLSQPLEPNFWTGSILLILVAANGIISVTGFGGNKVVLRTVDAYLKSSALGLLFFQAVLGLKLGLAI
jgi:hypothetical protein